MDTESFRDNIATADKTGQRIMVYPARPKGRLYNFRKIAALLLLSFLFVAPFIKLNGQPLILLNVFERQFVLFGLLFRPQDFHLLVLAVLTLIVFVLLFTAVLGRLFCGWVCPQTIFMEMLYRPIERWIDGTPAQQRKLKDAPWGIMKIAKRLLKHSIFFGLAIIICNYFLAYIIGAERTIEIVTQSPWAHPAGFTAVFILSFLFYGVYSWFREQVCTLVCPYGRLQSVLIDSGSIVVAYDYGRGEPRGKYIKGELNTDRGDCIDCHACVRVCPTAIDIRNGTQLECINCTSCIDACNSIMKKTGRHEGLIRYTSENRLTGSHKFKFTGKMYAFAIIFALLFTLSTVLLATRSSVETTILRTPGSLYIEGENGIIRNLYTVKMANKTFEEMPISFRLKSPAGGFISLIGGDVVLNPGEITESAFYVDFPGKQLYTASIMITVEIVSNDRVIDEAAILFWGPGKDIAN